MFKNKNELVAFTTLSLLSLHPALAQTTDWSQPVQQGFSSLTVTVVAIAGGLIGLAIVIYAIMGAAKHKIEYEKLWTFIVAAAIIAVGPAAITWAIQKFQASTGG